MEAIGQRFAQWFAQWKPLDRGLLNGSMFSLFQFNGSALTLFFIINLLLNNVHITFKRQTLGYFHCFTPTPSPPTTGLFTRLTRTGGDETCEKSPLL